VQLTRDVGIGSIDFVRTHAILRSGGRPPHLLVSVGLAKMKDVDANHLTSFLYFQYTWVAKLLDAREMFTTVSTQVESLASGSGHHRVTRWVPPCRP
jgi:hypothetical protein